MKKNKRSKFFLRIAAMVCIGFIFYPNLKELPGRVWNYYTARALLSGVESYLSDSCESFVIYYTEADADFVPLLRRAVDLYYPLMAKDFQIQGLPKLKIILYPDGEALTNNIRNGQDAAPMGVYYGGIVHILSPQIWVSGTGDSDRLEAFLEQGPLVHEIAHYLTDIKTGGKYEVWFAEGVALYYEYKYTAFEWRKDLKEEAGRLTFEELTRGFNQINQGVAYRKAFDLVNGMVERNGEAALQTFIASGGS